MVIANPDKRPGLANVVPLELYSGNGKQLDFVWYNRLGTSLVVVSEINRSHGNMLRTFFGPIVFFLSFALLLSSNSPARGQQAYTNPDELVLPEFMTDSPRYCLLTFPANKKERQTVLMVTDGDRLHVDRNSDGDLTNDGPFLNSKRREWESERYHKFTTEELKVGNKIHKTILIQVRPLEIYSSADPKIRELLTAEPAADSYTLSAEIQDDRFQGTWGDGRVIVSAGLRDLDGVLQFGKSLETAPTINLCGDLEIRLASETQLRPGAETDVVTLLGTPGNGAGTFARLGYEGVVPEFLHPRLTLNLTSAETGETETTTYELGHRC